MGRIESFRDLRVYRLSLHEAKRIFALTQDFPADERYSMTDQVRRSPRAVGAMLAEAWARRRYRADFVNKVSQALGEAMETQAWLDHARSSGYLDQERYEKHDEAWQHVGAMLNRMIQRANDFCGTASG